MSRIVQLWSDLAARSPRTHGHSEHRDAPRVRESSADV